jgi:hypothetical protein
MYYVCGRLVETYSIVFLSKKSSSIIPSFQNKSFPSLVTVSIEQLPMGSQDGVINIVPYYRLDCLGFEP